MPPPADLKPVWRVRRRSARRGAAAQIFFDYLKTAYQHFLMGNDDTSELEDQVPPAAAGQRAGRQPLRRPSPLPPRGSSP